MPRRRWIAHLDMDAFYASVELLRYPELRGLPVVIGGGRRHQPVLQADGTRRFATLHDYKGRGVITTATYAARAFGVNSAMGLMKAALLCPLDRMMVETDAPFLAPVPHRGKPNRPALVSVVGAAIAELREIDTADLAAATWATAERFYRLPAAA